MFALTTGAADGAGTSFGLAAVAGQKAAIAAIADAVSKPWRAGTRIGTSVSSQVQKLVIGSLSIPVPFWRPAAESSLNTIQRSFALRRPLEPHNVPDLIKVRSVWGPDTAVRLPSTRAAFKEECPACFRQCYLRPVRAASARGAAHMFKGSFTALISPFRNGAFDTSAYERLIEWQIAQGTHGLVPVGTTGESPTLSHEEHKHAVEVCVETARKRVPVIAGAGSNSTAEAI